MMTTKTPLTKKQLVDAIRMLADGAQTSPLHTAHSLRNLADEVQERGVR